MKPEVLKKKTESYKPENISGVAVTYQQIENMINSKLTQAHQSGSTLPSSSANSAAKASKNDEDSSEEFFCEQNL